MRTLDFAVVEIILSNYRVHVHDSWSGLKGLEVVRETIGKQLKEKRVKVKMNEIPYKNAK